MMLRVRMIQMELHNTGSTQELLHSKSKAEDTESTQELLHSESKADDSFHISPLKSERKGNAPWRETSNFVRTWILISFWHIAKQTDYTVQAHKLGKFSHSPITLEEYPKPILKTICWFKKEKNQTKLKKTTQTWFQKQGIKPVYCPSKYKAHLFKYISICS